MPNLTYVYCHLLHRIYYIIYTIYKYTLYSIGTPVLHLNACTAIPMFL